MSTISAQQPLHLSDAQITSFREIVWAHFQQKGREMPWRTDPSPYHVLVSEMMLQQTQVPRVIPKFLAFTTRFPDFEALASAQLGEVLVEWSGLGYNRRAKFLWEAARMVKLEHDGELPKTIEALVALPGIGKNTAGAIMAYAYEQPAGFIETNIRTVLLHHFYPEHIDVTDAQLLALVEQTLDREQPREWYWALMDYGTHLKKTTHGYLTQSKHYKKQAPLKGSLREMRGKIIHELTAGDCDTSALNEAFGTDARLAPALKDLEAEGLIHRVGTRYSLTPARHA